METSVLKKFAQNARRDLMEQVAAKMRVVLADNSAARRESSKAVAELEKAVATRGQEQVVERVAYIWFNRFCALRFMDVNNYSRVSAVSPAAGQSQPEILAEAKMGHVDEDMIPTAETRQMVSSLLGGRATSPDPQGEAYRLLLLAVCNYWNKAMPFMFERIRDYAELLMPDDLLSESSILARNREAMTEENCRDVEVIGWLYQFYISEKKDAVFDGLKKSKKVTPENIPAATQLFTPHWIVRYLVENSLGRLWMLNRPNSGLAKQMDYYIKPEQPETDFLQVKKPEDIKICDPACGSGHMLTYAFDLLYAIYEEEGYAPTEIPEKILTHNLYGVEIDERAGSLAAFALTMKARARHRGFFRKPVLPHICVLRNVSFSKDELARYMDFAGRDLFTAPLVTALHQFEEADNFGSLIRPEITNAAAMRKNLEAKNVGGNMLLYDPHLKVLRVLEQSEYLSKRYHVVIANPPYMGSKGMNNRLGAWAKDNYQSSKSDLFAMFLERNLNLALQRGLIAMITMQSWMFLASFETLRAQLAGQNTILSMAHLGARAFDSIGGEIVSTTAFVATNTNLSKYKGDYLRLVDGKSEEEKSQSLLEAIRNPQCGWFFRASDADFKIIPGCPIAYWMPLSAFDALKYSQPLCNITEPRKGMCTRDNDYFVRTWYEVSFDKIGFRITNRVETKGSRHRWFPYQKGGDFRRWYGNHIYVVDWEDDGYRLLNMEQLGWAGGSTNHNLKYIFSPAIIWSKISSSIPSYRYSPSGFLFDDASGLCSVNNKSDINPILAFLCSNTGRFYMNIINPTLNIQPGNMSAMPYIKPQHMVDIEEILSIAKIDWDSYETSWDFATPPMLQSDYHQPSLSATYTGIRARWLSMTHKMQHLDGENNRIFIEAYGLHDELAPEVPLNEITLTYNPHYRYGGDKTEEELETLLLADTMREFISYAVGCMFGRYALEKPGLVLANQGETFADYLKQIPNPSFPADEDNVLPILDGDWFTDDVTERFRQFLRVTFGEEHFTENLAFIENALGKTIRNYFLKDFYADHIKRYKKRPIYWLFSSPKGSFNALIYMHRYRQDTVSVVLNNYLREFRAKLGAEKVRQEAIANNTNAPQSERTKATKASENIKAIISELEAYERDILYPLATRQIEIDLDDGVKANYPKFGAALKKIPGLDAAEE